MAGLRERFTQPPQATTRRTYPLTPDDQALKPINIVTVSKFTIFCNKSLHPTLTRLDPPRARKFKVTYRTENLENNKQEFTVPTEYKTEYTVYETDVETVYVFSGNNTPEDFFLSSSTDLLKGNKENNDPSRETVFTTEDDERFAVYYTKGWFAMIEPDIEFERLFLISYTSGASQEMLYFVVPERFDLRYSHDEDEEHGFFIFSAVPQFIMPVLSF